MDWSKEDECYSRLNEAYQAFLLASNRLKSQHQGYGNEDRFSANVQQISYGGICGQEEEQRNANSQIYDFGFYDQEEVYQSSQWMEPCYSTQFNNPRWEDDQFYEDVLYEQYPPSPQKNSQDDSLMVLLCQAQEQQKEIFKVQKETIEKLEQIEARNKMLEAMVAQKAKEMSNVVEIEEHHDEEAHESLEDQCEEESDDEDGSMALDEILSFFYACLTKDELVPHLGESLEDEQEVSKGLNSHEDLLDNAQKEDLSRQFPIQQESENLKEDIESRKPMSNNEDDEDWYSAKSWSGVEEPNLVTPPPSKFLSFLPFMELPYGRNSHDPPLAKNSYLPRGSISSLDFHISFDGRRWRWDIKIS